MLLIILYLSLNIKDLNYHLIKRRVTMRLNRVVTIFLALPLFFINIYAKGLCIGYSSGDAVHLDYCRVSTKQKCFKDNNKHIDYNNTEDIFSGNDFFEFRDTNDSCQKVRVESARNTEEGLSNHWGNWIYSANLQKGDTPYIYAPYTNREYIKVYSSADFKSKVTLRVKKDIKVKILDKSKESKYQDMNSFWFKIKVYNKDGWIWGRYLHPNPFSPNSVYEDLVSQE